MPHSYADPATKRAQHERSSQRHRHYGISSFNPNVVAACAEWEWDRQGPLRRWAA